MLVNFKSFWVCKTVATSYSVIIFSGPESLPSYFIGVCTPGSRGFSIGRTVVSITRLLCHGYIDQTVDQSIIFFLYIPRKRLLRVLGSLTHLSVKLFKQAAVCYTSSILGFVNKKNGCDLTWNCPVGSNPVLSNRGGLPRSVLLCSIPMFHSTGYWEVP